MTWAEEVSADAKRVATRLMTPSEFDAMLDSFPANFHEPYYKSYLSEDLSGIFTEAGLQVVDSEPVFLSKRVVAKKS